MRKTTIIIMTLVALFVVSNVWWAHTVLDSGISYTYLQDSYGRSQEALSQSLAIISVIAGPDPNRSEIIEAAQSVAPTLEPFEKEGYLWVGSLGLKFDDRDRLVEVVPNF
jgi:hypothetical protein